MLASTFMDKSEQVSQAKSQPRIGFHGLIWKRLFSIFSGDAVIAVEAYKHCVTMTLFDTARIIQRD